MTLMTISPVALPRQWRRLWLRVSYHYYSEAVTNCTPEEDAQRREFTANGLFLDAASDEVVVYVGSRADLAAHRFRAIGTPAARFQEDQQSVLPPGPA